MTLSVSDVNRGSYIVNRYSRLAGQASACLSHAGTDKWNIFRGLNQRKMGFRLLAYPLCRSHREMIACRSSSRCLFLSPSHWTWLLNPAEVTKREFISHVLQKDIWDTETCDHSALAVRDWFENADGWFLLCMRMSLMDRRPLKRQIKYLQTNGHDESAVPQVDNNIKTIYAYYI